MGMILRDRQFLHWQGVIVKYFAPYTKKERVYLYLLATLSIVTTAANALFIWMLGVAISQITGGEFSQLNRTLLTIAGIVLFDQLLGFVYAYNYQRVTLRFVDRVPRLKLYAERLGKRWIRGQSYYKVLYQFASD
jgi:hypothetical protein